MIGTSMATTYATNIAIRILEINPRRSPVEAKAIILKGVKPWQAPEGQETVTNCYLDLETCLELARESAGA